MSKEGYWQKLTLKKIAEKDSVTWLHGKNPDRPLQEQPNYDVYALQTNRYLDGKEFDYITGPEWSIIQQSSSIKALHDLLGRRLGYNFKFEDWFEDWQEGFKWAINRTGTAGMKTNFPLKTVTQGNDTVKGWRTEREHRPAYLEWKNPSKDLKKDYRVIEYWKDRSINKSVILAGSDMQIIQQILQIEYEGGGTANSNEEQPLNGFEIEYTGAPIVSLYFNEKLEDVEEGYRPIQGKFRIRLVGKTDKESSLIPKLTNSDVTALALRIQQAFLAPEPFSYRRGKESVSIRDDENGVVGWQYVYSKAEGHKLFERIYQAVGVSYPRGKLNHSEPENATDEFPTIPPTTNILGHNRKERRRRPVGTVHFTSAKLFLSKLSVPVLLCDAKGYLFQGLTDSM